MMDLTMLYKMIAEDVTADIYQAYPDLMLRYGEQGRVKCVEDNMHHLKQLDTAFLMQDQKMFLDYAQWLNEILTSRGMRPELLIDNFERLERVVNERLPQERLPFYLICLRGANAALTAFGK